MTLKIQFITYADYSFNKKCFDSGTNGFSNSKLLYSWFSHLTSFCYGFLELWNVHDLVMMVTLDVVFVCAYVWVIMWFCVNVNELYKFAHS